MRGPHLRMKILHMTSLLITVCLSETIHFAIETKEYTDQKHTLLHPISLPHLSKQILDSNLFIENLEQYFLALLMLTSVL